MKLTWRTSSTRAATLLSTPSCEAPSVKASAMYIQHREPLVHSSGALDGENQLGKHIYPYLGEKT